MNDLEKELEKTKVRLDKIKKISNDLFVANSIARLINIFAIKLFGTEEENKRLTEQVEKEAEAAELALKNKEKGLVEWFDENLKPISEDFGCPYCGEYCYPVNFIPYGSICEVENCEFSGQTMIYCPKKKCNFELFCQSVMIPLGMVLDENSRYGYEKDETFSIFYREKIYNFKVISEHLTPGMLVYFIRKFFDYDLTRKEMNEYVILESINER